MPQIASIPAHINVAIPNVTVTPASVDFGTVGPDAFPSVTLTLTNPTGAAMNGIVVSLMGTLPAGTALMTTVLSGIPPHSSLDQNVQIHIDPNIAVGGDFNFQIVLTK